MNIFVSGYRFALVGAASTAIHAVTAFSLIKRLHFDPVLANALAFIVANVTSYIANARWSFRSNLSSKSWRRFISISLVAWLLTIAIAWSVEKAGGPYLLGIALVVIVVPPFTFLAHRWYTFADQDAFAE